MTEAVWLTGESVPFAPQRRQVPTLIPAHRSAASATTRLLRATIGAAPPYERGKVSVARTMLWSEGNVPVISMVAGFQLTTTFHSSTRTEFDAKIQSMLLPVLSCRL